MEVALQINLDEAPLMATKANASASPVFSKHILRVDAELAASTADYLQGSIFFTHVSALQAVAELNRENHQHDAILINPSSLDENIQELKQVAQHKAIPLILYTAKFEQRAKELALKNGLDEYHYGAITRAFLKRIDFIRKLKEYKNSQRGAIPYEQVRVMTEIPKIKMWSLKRAFDIVVSALGLLFLSPLLLLIAILIKLESKGPIFYISKRAGAGYKIFDFYKFRSMRVGADQELQKLAHLNQYGKENKNGVFFKIKDDPRITRVGNFIRNTSLDELPQLFNVLKGDMSLVGNRPLPLYEAEKLTKDHIAWRFLAPAGITGLWQVTKRGKENMSPEERISLDMEYAMKNSFWLDLKILFSTVPALLQKEKV